MRSLCFAICAFSLFFHSNAFADIRAIFTVEQKLINTKTRLVIYYSKDALRTETSSQGMPRTISIVEHKSGQTYVLDPERKIASLIPPQLAGTQAEAKVAPNQRFQLSQKNAPLGRLKADRYTAFEGNKRLADYYFVPLKTLGISTKEAAALDISAFQALPTARLPKAQLDRFKQSFPMRIQVYEGKQVITEVKVTSIKQVASAPARYKPPKNYKVTDLSIFGTEALPTDNR